MCEDNPQVTEVAAGLLESLGHTVRIVGNAPAALSAIQESAPPDLVFSDIVMAGEMDGLGLARLLRERHPQLPILLATRYSQAMDREAGAFRVMRKPYSLLELENAIGEVMPTPWPQGKAR